MLGKIKSLINSLLANRHIRHCYTATMKSILYLASANRLTSIIYHYISVLTFSREQHALIRGRYQFYKTLGYINKTNYRLRRNTHRLEKGLLFSNRRKVFALKYIEETIDAYQDSIEEYLNSENVDLLELEWATDVLAEYFKVSDSEKLKELKERYIELSKSFENADKETSKSPYKISERPENKIAYEELLELSRRRRSVRWFQEKQVPRDLIDQALLVARQAPTACNRMPYEFRIFDEPEMVKKVANTPFGTAGYADNIPVIIVVIGKQDSFFSPRDRHLIYIDSSLAIMSFMYALETLGLASCPINWPDFEPLEYKMQKLLNLKVYERPIMLIGVGYPDPDGKVAYSEKKDLDTFRFYNKT